MLATGPLVLRQTSLAFSMRLDLLDQLLGVDLGEGEIEDTLDGEGKTDDQADDDQGHELRTTFDELGLEGLVDRHLAAAEEIGCAHLFLGECANCREGHGGCTCQKHEKLFHNEFNNVLVVIYSMRVYLKAVQFSKKNPFINIYFEISPFRLRSKSTLTLSFSAFPPIR